MVFVSKFLFEKGINVVRCLDCDDKFEKLALVDSQNRIIFFFLSSFHDYFSKYRNRFEQTHQFSKDGIELPLKISEIQENNSSIVMQIKFSPTRFMQNVQIINDNEKMDNGDILEEKFSFSTKSGKSIKLMSVQKKIQNRPMKNVNSNLLAVAFENGIINIYHLISIHTKAKEGIDELTTDYFETWVRQFKLTNDDSLSIIDFKWSEDSKFIYALYYSQEVWVWSLNLEDKIVPFAPSPQRIHKISFGLYQIKTLVSARNGNMFYAVSNENIFSVKFSNKKIETFKFLENKNPPKEDSENEYLEPQSVEQYSDEESKERETQKEGGSISEFLFFENGSFICGQNLRGNLLMIPYHEPNSFSPFIAEKKGLYVYKLSSNGESTITMSFPDCFDKMKVTCCIQSDLGYVKSVNENKNFKLSKRNIYTVFACLAENSIFIMKLKDYPKNNKPSLALKILDLKFILNYGLWIDPYTLLVNDENGRMWYVKFNYMELGYALSVKKDKE